MFSAHHFKSEGFELPAEAACRCMSCMLVKVLEVVKSPSRRARRLGSDELVTADLVGVRALAALARTSTKHTRGEDVIMIASL